MPYSACVGKSWPGMSNPLHWAAPERLSTALAGGVLNGTLSGLKMRLTPIVTASGDPRMVRPARQRKAVAAIALAIASLCASGAAAHAQEANLLTTCASPVASDGKRTLMCTFRASGPAEIENVRARLEGESADLTARFEPFDAAQQGSTTYYLIQMLPRARRATLAQMAEAVATIADQREGLRRFTAYTFADELTPVASSGVSRDEFVRQLIAIDPATDLGGIHLYKAAETAVKALAGESGVRKSLVILADGTSDEGDATADAVLAAAREAGVTIHVLGYYDDARGRAKFEEFSRLAMETGGYAAEVKRGSGSKNDFTKAIVSGRYLSDVIENGGTLTAELEGPAGEKVMTFTAELADGTTRTAMAAVAVPPRPPPPERVEAPAPVAAAPPAQRDGPGSGLGRVVLILALGAAALLGTIAYQLYGREILHLVQRWLGTLIRAKSTDAAEVPGIAPPPAALPPPDDAQKTVRVGKPGRRSVRAARKKPPAVYGWLETLEGDEAARHPLRTTNVRVGRNSDNDICLQNTSISRRHALLHYDAETRRFTITDLGAGNGVIVNAKRTKSRELNDGDMVELGEVRLRFRAEPEYET